MLLDRLPEFLGSRAGPLLIGICVYREPVDRNAVLFQVGLHDWAAAGAPGSDGPAPPYQAPSDLTDLIAACADAGLLAQEGTGGGDAGRGGSAVVSAGEILVDERVTGHVRRLLAAAGREAELTDAHRRAAQYWQWRAADWPQGRRADIHDLLEARQHLLSAGDVSRASELTEVVCAQLRAWGDLGRAARLIRATLEAMPSPSAARAQWLHELGATEQAQGEHAVAEYLYTRAVKMFAQVGDASEAARSHESLGVLAHGLGEYRKAERHYRDAAAASHRASQSRESKNAPEAPAIQSRPEPDRETAVRPDTEPPVPPAAGAPATDVRRSRQRRRSRPSRRAQRPARPMVVAGLSVVVVALASTAAAAFYLTSTSGLPGSGGAGAGRAAPGGAGSGVGAAVWGSALRDSARSAGAGLSRAGSGTDIAGAGITAGGRAAGTERGLAAAWVARQVSRSAVVACDPAMCAALRARGVPAGDLLALGPRGGSDPLGSDIVMATAAVRSELGTRLADVYAPLVIARFGTGGVRIEVRVTAPDGAPAYRRALRSDLLARVAAGGQLTRNGQLSVAPAARLALAGGQVDSRTLTTIAAMADLWPIRVIGFGDIGPGADAAAPLRSAEIAAEIAAGPSRAGAAKSTETARSTETIRSAGTGTARALGAMLAFLRAQRPPYLAASVSIARLPGGGAALIFEFASPSPLGLLAASGPQPRASNRP